MIELIGRALRVLRAREGWRTDTEGSVLERMRGRPQPARIAVQWLVHIVPVVALATGRPIMLFIGAWMLYALFGSAYTSSRRLSRNLAKVPRLDDSEPAALDSPLPGVTLVAPARNEADEIGRAARSWAALDYDPLEIIAVNDHSTDATPQILEEVAAESPRLRVLHDPPIKPGWLGKPNAVRYALEQSNPNHPWLLFIDADTIFHPQALKAAVQRAERDQLDYLTCIPTLETGSFAEKLLLPLSWCNVATSVPREHLNKADSAPVGMGAFMLARRDPYERSRGHARHPNVHSEDAILAGVMKEGGGKVDVVLGGRFLWIRPYIGFKAIFRSHVAKIRAYGDDSILRTLSYMSALALPMLLPLPLAVLGGLHWAATGTAGLAHALYILTAAATYVQRSLAYRPIRAVSDVSPATGWLHPLKGAFDFAVGATAIAQILFRVPRRWRGRVETREGIQD